MFEKTKQMLQNQASRFTGRRHVTFSMSVNSELLDLLVGISSRVRSRGGCSRCQKKVELENHDNLQLQLAAGNASLAPGPSQLQGPWASAL